MFGGKGRSVSFYEDGDALFEVMLGIEKGLGVRAFFVMDENFLLHRKRALRLLELMREHGKSWALYVFSSANALRQYTDEELVGLGVSWVWLGLEGKASAYAKLNGTDTLGLVSRLQSLGIRVLGSSIVGLPEHDAVDDRRARSTTPWPTTPSSTSSCSTRRCPARRSTPSTRHEGTLLPSDECPDADTHGQLRFNYRHPRIRNGEETEYLLRAFRRDFETNGPSVTRIARTLLRGYLALHDHPDPRVRERVLFETKDLPTRVRGGPLGGRALVRAHEPRPRRAPAGDAARDRARVRLEGAGRRARRGTGGSRHAVARGAAAAPRPHLRAADVLRGEPGRPRAARDRLARRGRVPLGRAARRRARGPKRSPEDRNGQAAVPACARRAPSPRRRRPAVRPSRAPSRTTARREA